MRSTVAPVEAAWQAEGAEDAAGVGDVEDAASVVDELDEAGSSRGTSVEGEAACEAVAVAERLCEAASGHRKVATRDAGA